MSFKESVIIPMDTYEKLCRNTESQHPSKTVRKGHLENTKTVQTNSKSKTHSKSKAPKKRKKIERSRVGQENLWISI